MKALPGREFARLLEGHGWRLLRIKGSHHIFGKPGQREILPIPVPGNRTLKIGLQRHFMKVAAISEQELD